MKKTHTYHHKEAAKERIERKRPEIVGQRFSSVIEIIHYEPRYKHYCEVSNDHTPIWQCLPREIPINELQIPIHNSKILAQI